MMAHWGGMLCIVAGIMHSAIRPQQECFAFIRRTVDVKLHDQALEVLIREVHPKTEPTTPSPLHGSTESRRSVSGLQTDGVRPQQSGAQPRTAAIAKSVTPGYHSFHSNALALFCASQDGELVAEVAKTPPAASWRAWVLLRPRWPWLETVTSGTIAQGLGSIYTGFQKGKLDSCCCVTATCAANAARRHCWMPEAPSASSHTTWPAIEASQRHQQSY